MKIPFKIQEYVWLIETLRKKPQSLASLNEKWVETELSGGVEMARSTFNRHKQAIEDMFGVYIECNIPKGYLYYIGNPSVLKDDSVTNWMLNTLSVNHLISESFSLQDRILLEPAPVEGEYLKTVLAAMKQNLKLTVGYRKYGKDMPNQLTFEPYCIKLYRQRWYVLGHFHKDATEEREELDYFGLFSFDRIAEMHMTEEKFVLDPDFDATVFFSECFGVVVNDCTLPEQIILRAYDYERFYMRDLPVHHSQTIIREGENYTDFELFMRPTVDFSTYLLSKATVLKVLSPEWLADEVYNMLLDGLSRYDNDLE